MHRVCDVMLRMAQRVLSANGKSCGGWRREFCLCLAEDGFLSGGLDEPSVPFEVDTTQTH